MIINIDDKNIFNRIILEPSGKYSLRLISLHAIISSYVPAGIYKICTNLIDRENGNSDRILAYVRFDRKQHTVDFTPTQSVWYKLRWLDISVADVYIKSMKTDEKLSFSAFACQLEVKDDRI